MNQEIALLGLPNLYRDFTFKENMFTTLGNAVFALLFIISTLATIILFAGFGSGLGVIYLVVSLLLDLVWNSNRKSIGKRRKRALSPITYRRISSLAIFRKHVPKYYIF